MTDWENWEISNANEDLVDDLCEKLKSQSVSDTTSIWWDLFYENAFSNDNLLVDTEANDLELNHEEKTLVTSLKESLETNVVFQETSFVGIQINSLYKIFKTLSENLDDLKFSLFCEFLISWNNDVLVEQAMKAVILPRLRERSESSACTIFAMTELAKSKPSQLCYNVLDDLLSDETVQFTDFELLGSIYDGLPEPQKDFIVVTITKKNEISENDWKLLQPVIKHLSSSGTYCLTECIKKWSSKFAKSQVFGKFLVNFCKNLGPFDNKEILVNSIQTHETLFKKQALKILQVQM